mmetsp:Transcript_38145/g.112999  ORF Transcript_38145/g.112999 Transcript_38145/m.112999 type:complete len:255 (-) Transcript_38145:127-891(-)
MSMRPIFGAMRSRCFCLSFFDSSFSAYVCRISPMPVASMKSGSLKGGFSIPRLPCRYLRFCDQWRGTWTVLRYALRYTRSCGSGAVTSHTSTTSGRSHSCFSSAILRRDSIFRWRLDSAFLSSPSLSLSDASPPALAGALPASSGLDAGWAPASSSESCCAPVSSSAVANRPNTFLNSAMGSSFLGAAKPKPPMPSPAPASPMCSSSSIPSPAGASDSGRSTGADTYSISTSSSGASTFTELFDCFSPICRRAF